LARTHGTPLYVIDARRVAEQAEALDRALGDAGLAHVVRLALKAQREPELLRWLRQVTPFLGLDVCSPGEIAWGLDHGWLPDEISYTGTNLSDGDVRAILESGVHLNVDLLTQLDRVGTAAPGAAVGIRVNPRAGAGGAGTAETPYAGTKPTKFGIFAEQLEPAVELARRHRLTIDTVHFHTGNGYLTAGFPVVEEVAARVADMVRYLQSAGCPVAEVNTGGGLGVPEVAGAEPLDLARWAKALSAHLGPLDVVVGTEPGEFLTKECSIHLAEVVTVEDRDGVCFVGLDTGWNVMCERFIYGDPLELVLCRAADAAGERRVTISGNINEGNDLFAEDYPFPDVVEGDIVAAVNVGSYDASMTSQHCLRGPVPALTLTDREPVQA
jgi:diaminopimelate decarboxylase